MTAQSTQTSQKGFTLIELLVTIAIIAIISVVAVALFGNIQADARDAKRISELEAIANALEVNKTSTGYQPISPNKFGGGNYPAPTAGSATALDPSNYPYCLSFNNTGAAITNATTANFATTPVCNAGGTSGYVVINGTDLSSAIPTAGTTTWKVCTRLESKGVPSVVCRSQNQ